MAVTREISCINKKSRADPLERIQNVGGVGLLTAWKMTEDQAIAGIESGTYAFYTLARGTYAEVVVRQHLFLGHKYLTTHPDQTKENNLLYLPECLG